MPILAKRFARHCIAPFRNLRGYVRVARPSGGATEKPGRGIRVTISDGGTDRSLSGASILRDSYGGTSARVLHCFIRGLILLLKRGCRTDFPLREEDRITVVLIKKYGEEKEKQPVIIAILFFVYTVTEIVLLSLILRMCIVIAVLGNYEQVCFCSFDSS